MSDYGPMDEPASPASPEPETANDEDENEDDDESKKGLPPAIYSSWVGASKCPLKGPKLAPIMPKFTKTAAANKSDAGRHISIAPPSKTVEPEPEEENEAEDDEKGPLPANIYSQWAHGTKFGAKGPKLAPIMPKFTKVDKDGRDDKRVQLTPTTAKKKESIVEDHYDVLATAVKPHTSSKMTKVVGKGERGDKPALLTQPVAKRKESFTDAHYAVLANIPKPTVSKAPAAASAQVSAKSQHPAPGTKIGRDDHEQDENFYEALTGLESKLLRRKKSPPMKLAGKVGAPPTSKYQQNFLGLQSSSPKTQKQNAQDSNPRHKVVIPQRPDDCVVT